MRGLGGDGQSPLRRLEESIIQLQLSRVIQISNAISPITLDTDYTASELY